MVYWFSPILVHWRAFASQTGHFQLDLSENLCGSYLKERSFVGMVETVLINLFLISPSLAAPLGWQEVPTPLLNVGIHFKLAHQI